MSAGVLHTSVFIANEAGRPLNAALIPNEVATTVVTLAELTAGVLAAGTSEVRAQRLATLDTIADVTALPVDEEAARMWARMRVHLADAEAAWARSNGNTAALDRLRRVLAIGVACGEQHGIPKRDYSSVNYGDG